MGSSTSNLDGHRAVVLAVRGQEHDGHAPATDFLIDLELVVEGGTQGFKKIGYKS